MNISVIASGYPSQSKPVLDIFIHEQTKEMVRQGLDVHVITTGTSEDLRDEIMDGVHVHRVIDSNYKPSCLFFLAFSFKTLRKTIQLNKRLQFDIIHSHFADHAGFAGVITSKMLRKPFVLTAHGYDVYYNKKLGYGLGSHLLTRFLTRFILKMPDRITVASEALKRHLKTWNVDPKRVEIISNGINLDCVKNNISPPKRFKDCQVVLTVTRLIPLKNVEYVLEAMPYVVEKFPDVQYIVVGDGPEREKLERIADKRGLANNVKFVGELKHNELPRYYSMADVFVLPSVHEGFGIVKLEAFAFGVPVIVTDGGGAVEGVSHWENGFIVPLNQPKKLAEAIITILSNLELKESMGRRGKEIVMKEYLWEHNVKKVTEMYKGLLYNRSCFIKICIRKPRKKGNCDKNG
jgi:teichuronic acid biosynthesis glycosyltransferase TuaC